ncbi:hypothetical protein TSTA_037730 [Talaromyces stipitatus ATCC 10500]|uniref:NACHT domain-containing protein n=1 Tax=Talaromyces stipitatus (strain ATCC 10500 / CBS 375.48 / QM 6759 / NRRL 1006) TaxID=441959 RepID=B8M8P2_TALSN|nr:uncharacterized protein TSTA_037730 [Talaromyces stipitatus ATCC 10500]EED20555.1 hypothetical protein TSTA_037730 [Talaromyces stipitatus ATCC 10500]
MGEIKKSPPCLFIEDDTEYKDCLASMWFDELDARRAQVSPAAAETNSWIWEHPVYHEFCRQTAGILWIRGKPGSGKSVLAKSIRSRLLEQSEPQKSQGSLPLIGDWFYHRRRGGRYIQHESFLRSILYHFLHQCPEVFPHYVEAYREMSPRSVVWSTEVLESILVDVCRGSRPVLCVVDAVDEAEGVEILALIKRLTDAAAFSRAKFIVLSRNAVKIEQHIFGLPTIVMEDENQGDIASIIDIGLKLLCEEIHKLDFMTRSSELVFRTRSIPRHATRMRQPRYKSITHALERETQTIKKMRIHLASKAQGSILWAKLVLDKLTRHVVSDPNCSLEELSRSVTHTPQELKEYYKQIVNEMTDRKSADRIQDIRRILMWICAAGEISGVTLEELWEAVAVLKDCVIPSTMEEIWAKRTPIRSYDEFWRKIYSTCGPFIEVYNPGLSAEESRRYQYGASSIVQLMHQSVRDFLCDESSVGCLSFTIDEARDLVKTSLHDYLQRATRKLGGPGAPFDAGQLIEDLENLKLLRYAIDSAKNYFIRCDIAVPNVQLPLRGSPQHDLITALTTNRHAPEAASTYYQNTPSISRGWEMDGLVSTNLLFYVACSQGLVTAVMNMLALKWNTPPYLSGNGEMILYGVLLAASRCRSTKIQVGFYYAGVTQPDERGATATERPARNPDWPSEMPLYMIERTSLPSSHSTTDNFSEQPSISASSTLIESEVSLEERPVNHTYGRNDDDLNFVPRVNLDGDWENLQEQRTLIQERQRRARKLKVAQSHNHFIEKGSLAKDEDEWISIRWEVTLSVRLLHRTITKSLYFREWCSLLDLTCGTKRCQPISDYGMDDGIEFSEEDVEDAIVAALEDNHDADYIGQLESSISKTLRILKAYGRPLSS